MGAGHGVVGEELLAVRAELRRLALGPEAEPLRAARDARAQAPRLADGERVRAGVVREPCQHSNDVPGGATHALVEVPGRSEQLVQVPVPEDEPRRRGLASSKVSFTPVATTIVALWRLGDQD